MTAYDLSQLVRAAYNEDCPNGDVTSEAMLASDSVLEAQLLAKEDGVFFGHDVIHACIDAVDGSMDCLDCVSDGALFTSRSTVARFRGPASSLLKFERVMLNFIQRLSGVATTTRAYVDALGDASIAVMDTRKTTPLFRFLERQAVVAGGGVNHRLNLSDMVLIKENHLRSFFTSHSDADLGPRLAEYKKSRPELRIEIEVERVEQLRLWDLAAADIIMLDNFSLDDLSDAISVIRERGWTADIEISGGIQLDTISAYRGMNIQRISVGSLTHSVRSIDFSLLF